MTDEYVSEGEYQEMYADPPDNSDDDPRVELGHMLEAVRAEEQKRCIRICMELVASLKQENKNIPRGMTSEDRRATRVELLWKREGILEAIRKIREAT